MKTLLIFISGVVIIVLALIIDKSAHARGLIGIIGLIIGWGLVCFLGLYRL
jgi:hypothetical protein